MLSSKVLKLVNTLRIAGWISWSLGVLLSILSDFTRGIIMLILSSVIFLIALIILLKNK